MNSCFIRIDGALVRNWSLANVRKAIVGQAGTLVSIEVDRFGRTFTSHLYRENSDKRSRGDAKHLKLRLATQFEADALAAISEAADLQNDGGGTIRIFGGAEREILEFR